MEAFADTPPPLPLGQVLAAERERQGLSRADAAQRLHMSMWQVEALESGDYSRLPKGTFLRGFVRNYARLLGLDTEAAVESLAQAELLGPRPAIVVPSQNIRFDPLGDRFDDPYVKAFGLAAIAVLLGFAATYWWIYIKPAPPAAGLPAGTLSQAQAGPGNQPAPMNIAVAPVPPPEPVAAPREAPREEAKAEPKAEAPKVEARAAAPRKANERTIKLRFRGESWVEIRDRSGKALVSALHPAGSEAELSGRPPFTVTVGNAPEVTLLYDGREFALEPHTKVAVARFTLE